MSYHVDFTDVADMEVQNILLRIMGRTPEYAERWQEGLEKAVQSLEDFPGRCAVVREVSTPERQVRQLLYGAYRLLFTLLDTDGDGDLDTVRLLHVRHGAQGPLTQGPLTQGPLTQGPLTQGPLTQEPLTQEPLDAADE